VAVSHFRRKLIDGFTDYCQMMQHRGLRNLIGEKGILGRGGDD